MTDYQKVESWILFVILQILRGNLKLDKRNMD